MSSSVSVSIGVPSLGFNFDELSSLAITDPAKFEELRLALIKQVINSPGSNAWIAERMCWHQPTYHAWCCLTGLASHIKN